VADWSSQSAGWSVSQLVQFAQSIWFVSLTKNAEEWARWCELLSCHSHLNLRKSIWLTPVTTGNSILKDSMGDEPSNEKDSGIRKQEQSKKKNRNKRNKRRNKRNKKELAESE